MAAPTIAAVGTFQGGNDALGSTVSLGKPSGVVNGSLLLALYSVEHSASGTLLAAPSGWTKAPDSDGAFQAVSQGTAAYAFYKIVTDAGSEPSTYAMPVESARWRRGAILRIAGHDPSNPFDGGDGAVSANSSSVPSTSVTTAGVDRLVLWHAVSYNLSSWPTMPTSFAEVAEYASASTTVSTLAQRTVATASTITTGAIATGVSTGKAGWLGAIRPEPTAPPLTAPGTVFDLSRWHLTTPEDDGGTAAQIDQPELATFASEHFYLDESDRMVGVAPVNGATTSGSEGTRAELREHEDGSYANSAWDPLTTGRRQLTICCQVDSTSITGGTLPRQEGIFAQIHGATGTPPIYLTAEWTSNGTPVATPRVRAFVSGTGMSNFNLLSPITPTTDIAVRIRVDEDPSTSQNRLRMWAVLGTEADLPPLTTTPNFERPCADFTDKASWYFKHLAYNKTETDTGSTGETIVKTSFLELLQPGDPDPADTVTGTATVALGALSVVAVGTVIPEVVTGTASVVLGAVSVTAAGTRTTPGVATLALGALSVSAEGTVIAEVVTGAASVVLGGLTVAAVGTRTTSGTASIALGGLVLSATTGVDTVTGTAMISLGPVSVTAVGTVVAEVVTGSAHVVLPALAITGVGTRATAGTAVVALPGLVVVAVGIGATPDPHPRLVAGQPVAARGPIAGQPVSTREVGAGEPAAVRGPSAGAPASVGALTGDPVATPAVRAGAPS